MPPLSDEELWRAYENACRCGSSDAVWMKDEIEARLAKRNAQLECAKMKA